MTVWCKNRVVVYLDNLGKSEIYFLEKVIEKSGILTFFWEKYYALSHFFKIKNAIFAIIVFHQ